MKKITQILTAIILAVFAMPAVAQTDFVYEDNNKSIIHNGVTVDEGKAQEIGSNAYTGDIVVPEGVTTLKKVTVSGGWFNFTDVGTFQYSTITSCQLPATVTDIQQGAFSDCPYLMNIFVDENNEKYMDIDGVVYEYTWDNGVKKPTKLVAVPGGKTSVLIPETVEAFVVCAMDGCINIKELTISSNTLNSIGSYAFADMHLDKLTIYSTSVPTVANSNAFDKCTISAIYVQKDLVDSYKNASGWTKYENVIFPIEDNVVAGSFKVNIKLTEQNYNAQNEVYQIYEIEVTGAASETFATDPLPAGWALTDANGTPYDMKLGFTEDKKTVKITFNPAITAQGVYTLRIPASSLKTEDGDENDMAQETWEIQQKVVNNTVEKQVTIRLEDADETFKWSFTDVTGNPITSSETHIVGNTVYIDEEINKVGNTTTITTTVYKSANAEYVRTFNNNKWQALYVPFDLVYNPSWAGSFQLAVITDVVETVDKNKNVVWFYVTAETVESGTIKANTPCIIRSLQAEGASVKRTIALTSGSRIEAVNGKCLEDIKTDNDNTYRFKGQYTAGDLPYNSGKNFAMAGGALCQPAEGKKVNLGAYRWYLEINPSDENTTATFSFGRFDDVEGTTGLENVKVEIVDNDVYYDLSGRRVENPTKGIYIKNGKKVYVK